MRRDVSRRGFNYAWAATHFVTTNALGRSMLFGTVEQARAALNAYGMVVDDTWRWLGRHFPTVTLGAYVVMPDHIHGVVTLDPDRLPDATPRTLTEVVGAFKTVSAKRINILRGTPGAGVWQRGFYLRTITTREAAEAVARYIALNPLR